MCQCKVTDADELNLAPALPTDLSQTSTAFSLCTSGYCQVTPPPSHCSMPLPVTRKPAADNVTSPVCPHCTRLTSEQQVRPQKILHGRGPEPHTHCIAVLVWLSELGLISHVRAGTGRGNFVSGGWCYLHLHLYEDLQQSSCKILENPTRDICHKNREPKAAAT